MSRVFFISDAHLGFESKEKEAEKERRLLQFLHHVKQHGTHLFIVGDLFDTWIEYRTVIPKGYHRLFTVLEDLTQRGLQVHYLAGNHDYWMGNFFCEYLGVTTYSAPFTITIDQKKFYIHHGDGLAGKDLGYRILKKILRNPLSIWLYSWLHPDVGITIAKFSSRTSRNHTSQKDYGEEDGLQKFAAKKIAGGINYVIMGHSHQPTAIPIENGLYVNLGDWISYCTYAEFTNGQLELKTWRKLEA